MHSDRMPPDSSGDEQFENARDDAAWRSRVLALVLAEDPHQLTELELVRELLGPDPNFAERDALERAIGDLVRGGLVQRNESLIWLTRAARLFASLELE